MLRGINGFSGGSAPLEQNHLKPNFQNLKTQCYYLLSEFINAHKIAVRTEDETVKNMIIQELEVLKRKDADSDGKLKIISKDEVKELLGRSPDFADALMMRMWFELKPIFMEDLSLIREIEYNRETNQSNRFE